MKKKKILLDITKQVMSKKSEMKLSDVIKGCWKAGYKGTDSSRYIAVYQCLREHPQLFEHTSWGTYKMKSKEAVSITKDHEMIKDTMEEILHGKQMNTVQIWRALQDGGTYTTYRAISSYLRNDPRFTWDDASRYSVL